jgi:hypothetical protein
MLLLTRAGSLILPNDTNTLKKKKASVRSLFINEPIYFNGTWLAADLSWVSKGFTIARNLSLLKKRVAGFS